MKKFLMALSLSAPASAAAQGLPPSCYVDAFSQRCLSEVQRLNDLDRQRDLLDDQRFWIDMDARIREDDREYDAWFYREFIAPQPYYQPRRR